MDESERRANARASERRDRADPWQPVATLPFAGVVVFALAALWFGNRDARWFPVLDGANLLFHEFGHPFFGLFSERLAVYGGTLAQFVLPLVAAFEFRRRGATCSFAVCMVWLFQNPFASRTTWPTPARSCCGWSAARTPRMPTTGPKFCRAGAGCPPTRSWPRG